MKKLLLKSILLLCALVVGTSAWADTVSFIFTGASANCDAVSGTVSGINYETGKTGSATATAYNTTNGLVLYGVSSGGGFFNTTTELGGSITNIAVTTNNKKNSPKYTVYGSKNGSDWTQIGSQTDGGSTANFATTAGYTYVKIANTTEATAQLGVNSIVITYTPSEKTDPTITFNNGSVRVGKALDLSTLFTSNSAGTVTYSITSGESLASISGNTLTAGASTGNVTVQASQAAAGSYNAKSATATISVVDPDLSSIAITTAPTKTTYDEGDLFDKTGMVVTATFEDASTEDVTASCTWEPNGALATTDDEVTISYTYKGVTKTATQDITVNAYTQETQFDIALKNSLFGTSYSGTASGITDETPVSGTLNRVTVTYAGSGNHYINDSQIRFYPSNKLTFEAPAGYIITKIVFTSGGTWAATISSNNGTYTSGTKTWTGGASSVLFTGSGSSRCDMTKATVTLSNSYPVTIGSSKYAAFCSNCALDFSGTEVKAYKAKVDGGKVVLTKVDEVPANTGVILYGDADDYDVPVIASAAAVTENELIGVTTRTLVEWETGGDGKYNYILQNGQFKKAAAGGHLKANRAYLHTSYDVTSAGARDYLEFSFEGEEETTGVNEVTTTNLTNNTNEYFNLAGQKVLNPTKGLYIVNGKKVVIK